MRRLHSVFSTALAVTLCPLLSTCIDEEPGVELVASNVQDIPASPDTPQAPGTLDSPSPEATDPNSPSAPTCTGDNGCPSGTFCSAGRCLAPCTSNAECSTEGLVCDLASSRCVGCVSDGNCPSSQVCSNGSCTTLADDDMPIDDDIPVDDVPADDDTPDDDVPVDDDLPADDDMPVDDDVPADDDTPDDDTATCNGSTFDPCSAGIPQLTGTQTVDGNPDEFCDLPVAILNLSSAALTIGNPDASLPHRAEIRVAWSETALHLFANVIDPNVDIQAPPDSWAGDSLDVYVAATSSVSGSLGNDGTPQLILVPPAGGAAAAAIRYPEQSAISSGFTSTLTAEGYLVELMFPWPGGAVLSSGADVRVNFALNVREPGAACDPADLNTCRSYYGAYFAGSVGGDSECANFTLLSGTSAEPWCDNRTWCATTLQ